VKPDLILALHGASSELQKAHAAALAAEILASAMRVADHVGKAVTASRRALAEGRCS
jgi:hypothetical protein